MKSYNKTLALVLALLIALTATVGCSANPFGNPSDTIAKQEELIDSDPYPEPSEIIDSDPYENISQKDFYKNYTPATCYADALYRTKHYLMSGSIAMQDQSPSVADEQPAENGMLVRNTSAIYRENGNAYVVLDANGDEAFRVYRGGAYITLEEVAAYVYAFGDVPANYVTGKSVSPKGNPWGEYLRLNHSAFTGSTTKYPYEPELPNISGCGGDLYYYEIDIGTTGTDCDPRYIARIYNDGDTITRGAARIVYTRFDANRNNIIDPNEKFVFYTYNHYNDFQEYLNYEGGWGEMFGNVTGGGEISSKTDYNPSPYVQVARRDLSINKQNICVYYFFDQNSTHKAIASLLAKKVA